MGNFPEAISLLSIGFLFGFKHAFDADHLAAVSLLNVRSKNSWESLQSGFFWGLGHMITLLLVGIAVLFFRIQFSEEVSSFFEMVVALFLISYGLYSFVDFWKKRKIDRAQGVIVHDHPPMGPHSHPYPSFFVGVVHGLAGSAVILLLIISTIHSVFLSLLYLLIFGFGSLMGMALVSFSFGMVARHFKKSVTAVTSIFSMGTGALLLLSAILPIGN